MKRKTLAPTKNEMMIDIADAVGEYFDQCPKEAHSIAVESVLNLLTSDLKIKKAYTEWVLTR